MTSETGLKAEMFPRRTQSAAGSFGLLRETRRLGGASTGIGLAASSGACGVWRAGADRQVELRRVQFQRAVDQPKVTVAPMQRFRMLLVAEPDDLDDVFQGEIDEAACPLEREAWPRNSERLFTNFR